MSNSSIKFNPSSILSNVSPKLAHASALLTNCLSINFSNTSIPKTFTNSAKLNAIHSNISNIITSIRNANSDITGKAYMFRLTEEKNIDALQYLDFLVPLYLTDYLEPEGELSKGSKSDGVEWLQEALDACGYDVGKIDGDFGPKTSNALLQFQKDYGLSETGKFTSDMIEMMKIIALSKHEVDTIKTVTPPQTGLNFEFNGITYDTPVYTTQDNVPVYSGSNLDQIITLNLGGTFLLGSDVSFNKNNTTYYSIMYGYPRSNWICKW